MDAAGTCPAEDACGGCTEPTAATRVDFAPGMVSAWPTLSFVSGVMLLALAIAVRGLP
jgi:hypothetical protein